MKRLPLTTNEYSIPKTRKYYEQFFPSELEKLDKTNHFLDEYVSKLTQRGKKAQTPCCSLNVYVPSNTYIEILTPEGDGTSRWGLWGMLKPWEWSPHELH